MSVPSPVTQVPTLLPPESVSRYLTSSSEASVTESEDTETTTISGTSGMTKVASVLSLRTMEFLPTTEYVSPGCRGPNLMVPEPEDHVVCSPPEPSLTAYSLPDCGLVTVMWMRLSMASAVMLVEGVGSGSGSGGVEL